MRLQEGPWEGNGNHAVIAVAGFHRAALSYKVTVNQHDLGREVIRVAAPGPPFFSQG